MPWRFLTTSRKEILELLLERPRTLSELHSLTGKSRPTLLKHLDFLERFGLVTRNVEVTSVGKQVSYTLNRLTVFFHTDPAKRAFIAFKTSDPIEPDLLLAEQVPQDEFRRDVKCYLRAISKTCGEWDPLPTVIAFGSVARGEATWKSDIDVLIVLEPRIRVNAGRIIEIDEAENVLRDSLAEAASEAKHSMRPHFVRREEFIREDGGIIQEARSHGLMIFGDMNGGLEVWRQLTRYRSITI
jgi:predicted nucleotidyltransferase